jgi:hypothetical protein
MACVFELANVLELLIDGLEQGALAEQHFIPEREPTRLPLFFAFGAELDSRLPELSEEGLGEVAPLSHQFTEQPASKCRHGLAVIDVAWSKPDGQQLPAVVNDQRDFEAVEPARAGDPALGYILENLMRVDAQGVTDFQGGESMKERPVQRPKRVVRTAARGNKASASNSTKREELTRWGKARVRGRQMWGRENVLRFRTP